MADWCLLLARTDQTRRSTRGYRIRDADGSARHRQRPLRMINGVTNEFGEFLFDEARIPASNMIGEAG